MARSKISFSIERSKSRICLIFGPSGFMFIGFFLPRTKCRQLLICPVLKARVAEWLLICASVGGRAAPFAEVWGPSCENSWRWTCYFLLHQTRRLWLFRGPKSRSPLRRGPPWFVPISPFSSDLRSSTALGFREYPDLFRFIPSCSDFFRFLFRTNQNKSGKPLSADPSCKSPKKTHTLFQHKLFAPHPKHPILGPQKKVYVPHFLGKEDPHKLFRILGVKKGSQTGHFRPQKV